MSRPFCDERASFAGALAVVRLHVFRPGFGHPRLVLVRDEVGEGVVSLALPFVVHDRAPLLPFAAASAQRFGFV